MKRVFYMLLMLLLFMALPVCAHAWEWSLDDAGVLKITGTGPVEDFSSAADTPWYGKAVRQVVIHEGITELGSYAFRNCNKLTAVTLPDSLTTLGVSAFEGCSSLKTLSVGTGLRTVKQYAFLDCSALTGVYITDVDAWCMAEFVDYSSCPMYYAQALYVDGLPLTGVLELSPGVTKIPKYAFYGCTGLTQLHLPDTVRIIESDAFTYCSGLTEAKFGNGVTQIGSAAFSYCTALSRVSMGNNVTALGDYCFAYCTKLETIQLSQNLKQLGQRVFYDCTALEQLHFANALESVGSYAFYGCTGLKSVTVPESLTVIPAYAFRGCSALETLKLPDTLTTIEKYAFYGCSSLSVLTIPEAVTSIGNYAFHSCTGLQEIYFDAVSMADLSAGNYVFYKAGQPGLTVTVGSQVKHIPAYLFYPYGSYCPNVTYVVFEKDSSCAAVGKYAFANCKALKEVIFTGSAPTFGTNIFNNTTVRCLHPASWDSTVLQNYGGTVTWLPILVEAADGTVFADFEEALSYSCDLRLLWDVQANAALQKDLYVDLNGYDLSGILCTGAYKIFGTDATTDGYNGDKAGIFSCTDGEKPVIPEVHCKVDGKRYLAIKTEEGYSFHRFYMGITHMTLRPSRQGVGFKAVFYGDTQVCGQIAATGYTLTLEGFTSKSQWQTGAFQSGTPIRLLVQNFDAAQYGETPLTARLCLRLQDGTVLESSSCTMTLRSLMEQLNHTPDLLTQTQRQQISQWAARYPVMEQWKIKNLFI